LGLTSLAFNQGTGSPSPDDDFTISSTKDLLITSNNFNVSASQISSTSSGLGGLADPQLLLTNSNATINTIPTIEFNKTGRNLTAGEIVGSISMYGLDAGAQKTEFGRIQIKAENVSTGNEDGTLSIFNAVNGASLEVFNFNGGQNENNTFRPLDMNGNALRSNVGNLVLEATGSIGTGTISLAPKAGASVLIPSSAEPTTDFIRINPQVSANTQQLLMTATDAGTGFINSISLNNSQYAPSIELKADFGSPERSITISADGNAGLNSIVGFDLQANAPLVIDTSGYTNGSIELKVNDTTGDLILTSANIESASRGSNSGQNLRIKLNGVYYKIQLYDDT
jgi:hypothetical protein